MGITTNLVKLVLFSQMFLFTLLILPIPKYLKHFIINSLCNSKSFTPLLHLLYVIFTMILIMFIDALLKLTRFHSYDLVYHTERNLYLTGFTLYLGMIFKIFVNMLNTLYKEEESVKILKKQISNNQTFVDSMINKDEVIRDLKKTIVSNEIMIKQLKNNQGEYNALSEKYNELLMKIKRENKKSK
ncbi:reticulum transmembrane protein YET-like [Vairimorpha necatrix]|uniref:Reticulum transmembrane protein YET-like n=1 Tax=Vairimorpha necatrix TaxID=6039 RepID=A0AAX4JBV5_9MICR